LILTTLAGFHGAPVAVGFAGVPLLPDVDETVVEDRTPGMTFVGESTARGFTMGADPDPDPEATPEPDALD
jgi:hypothetical protein